MASTYALPVNPTSQSYGHGHSRSHYISDGRPAWTDMNGHSHSGGGHGHGHGRSHSHAHAEVNGQLRSQEPSPYANSNGNGHGHEHHHSHDHTHDRTQSTETLKAFMSGRPRGRPRGESDLGRPPSRKSAAAGKFGFSPIQEAPAVAPPPASPSSWLELPEALTALLIPLPFLFASLAYPSIVAPGRILTPGLGPTSKRLLEAVAQEASVESPNGTQLLHACTLSSTTLILVGIISKIRTALDQPLDRRKAFVHPNHAGGTYYAMFQRLLVNILAVLLPFYATMQLGGSTFALILLVAIATGLGGLEYKPGKHGPLDSLKRTLRTRKATCAILTLGMIRDILSSPSKYSATLGYLALAISIVAIPPPLPTIGWSLKTDLRDTSDSTSRVSLSKPSSPLVSTEEDTLLTLGAGVLLTIFTVLFSIVSSSSPSIAHHAITFSTLSVASAAALVFFSLPSALRTQKKGGLAIGILLVAAFGVYEHSHSWEAQIFFPLICAFNFGAVSFDKGSAISRPHSHGHSHSDHSHAHAHDHHLHGNHSKLSAFLIARCAPGSIVHSILIEKDSRRIAYFGVLNLSFMLVQFFYGFASGSLGLLTDSIHMLFDCAGLAVGLAAAVMSKWPPNAAYPYGYGKIDTLSGFANGVFLMLVSVEIIFDGFERLWEGHELQRLNELLIVSVLGFLVNIVGLTAFGHAHHGHGHSHEHGDHDHSHGHHHHDNENMQGIFLHILADALGSVAVIVSTLLTKYYGWSGWDPIASCIIAILIFVSAVPLVKSSGMRLLLSLPADVEYKIRNTLQELSSLRGVVGYTVPKFWLEDEGAAHSEVHAKEHDHSHEHGHGHGPGNDHSHNHGHEGHCDSSPYQRSHSHGSHDDPHSHEHHDHDHNHHDHDHDHDHEHSHAPRQQKVLGVIHIIASRAADLEDVRERTVQFLKGRGMDVVVHVEKEGEGRCWCGGGGNKLA